MNGNLKTLSHLDLVYLRISVTNELKISFPYFLT